MPLLALIIDAMAFGIYYLQAQTPTTGMFMIGLIAQIVLAIISLVIMVSYQGRRKQKHDYTLKGYRYLTIRFAIILFSFIINALMVFLYVLNLMGNHVVFPALG
ncbi:hypothetical protein [Paucilactobacillus sp. N302-9]